jgi:Mrp family chromosome partitioning ATPase
MHALALARTAALAGENVVLIDADLRRSGVTRLLNQDFSFTLSDFLQDRCTANHVIAIEERSGVHFVPSTSADVSWTSHDLHRFFNFVDYLKDRFAIVIIDLPPIVGLGDTIRLAMATDNIVLVIRWGRTERRLVQFALDTLRNASVSPIAVILNDIDLKAQRRRGYRDHMLVYGDEGLYRTTYGYREPDRVAPEYREPAAPTSLPVAAAKPDAYPETSVSEPRPDDAPRDRPRPAGSDIERLYDRYRG